MSGKGEGDRRERHKQRADKHLHTVVSDSWQIVVQEKINQISSQWFESSSHTIYLCSHCVVPPLPLLDDFIFSGEFMPLHTCTHLPFRFQQKKSLPHYNPFSRFTPLLYRYMHFPSSKMSQIYWYVEGYLDGLAGVEYRYADSITIENDNQTSTRSTYVKQLSK